jgi:hypothetical protein
MPNRQPQCFESRSNDDVVQVDTVFSAEPGLQVFMSLALICPLEKTDVVCTP